METLRKQILEYQGHPINILLIGDRSAGKSSFIQTCLQATQAKGGPSDVPSHALEKENFKLGTTFYRKTQLPGNSRIALFDCPGLSFEHEVHFSILEEMMRGMATEQLPLRILDLERMKKQGQFKNNFENAIDIVICIVDVNHVQKTDSSGSHLKNATWKAHPQSDLGRQERFLFAAKKCSAYDRMPFLVFSHADESSFFPEQFLDDVFPFVHSNDKFLLNCDVSAGTASLATQEETLCILHRICQVMRQREVTRMVSYYEISDEEEA